MFKFEFFSIFIMGKSLGDYNIAQSSSSDIKNIQWSQKNPANPEKPKKKKSKNFPSTNIIHTSKSEEHPTTEKTFKVEDSPKSKKEKLDKKSQNASLSNCNIEQGYRRPGR